MIITKDWKFCPSNQEITYKDGEVVELPSRLSRCLETLILAEGGTVPYDELLQKVWKTEYREASTVSSVVSDLRKIIKCGKTNVTYIKTVPKRGYRFIGEFEYQKDSPKITSTSLTIDTIEKPVFLQKSKSSTYFNKYILLSFMIMAIFLAIFSNYKGVETHFSSKSAENISYTQKSDLYNNVEILTYDNGVETEFDISTDGQWLIYAYQHTQNEAKKIKVKNILSGTSFVLDSNVGFNMESPRFSRDTLKVTYIRNTDSDCEIRVISFSSKGFDKDSDVKVSSCGLAGIWTTPTFSEDGLELYFSRSSDLTQPFSIIRHDLLSGFERVITSPSSSGRGDYSFSLSPDGTRLAIVRNIMWTQSSIIIHDLKSGDSDTIVDLPHLLYGVTWFDDDSLIYKGISKNLVRHELTTNQKAQLTSINEELNYPVVVDGKLYAFKGLTMDSEIWSLKYSANGDILEKIIDSPYRDFFPTRSNNGLYFLSDRSGSTQIWHKTGSTDTKITDFQQSININNLLYNNHNNELYLVTDNMIYSITAENKTPTKVIQIDNDISNVSLSSDHNKIIYTVENNERWYIEMYDVSSSQSVKLTEGFIGKLDSNLLFFTKFRQKGLWKLDLTNSDVTKVDETFTALNSQLWQIQNGELFFVDEEFLERASSKLEFKQRNEIKGQVRNFQCDINQNTCVMDSFGFGSTDIVELRNNKDFSRDFQN